METYNDNLQEEQNEQGITVGLNTMNDLRIAGQWGKLMAVLGFIGIGIMFVFGIFFMLFPFDEMYGGAMPYRPFYLGILYFILALVYIFPVIYLYKFSSRAKRAFLYRDEDDFNRSIQNLKILFRLTGIFTLASLVLIFIGLIFAVVVSIFAF